MTWEQLNRSFRDAMIDVSVASLFEIGYPRTPATEYVDEEGWDRVFVDIKDATMMGAEINNA
jgi:hypothetical protein